MIKKFLDFVQNIKKEDLIAILYHTDADGVCSSVITAKSLELLGIKPVFVFTQGAGNITITEKTIKQLAKKNITKVIILDLAVDSDPKPIKKIEEFAELLVVDHHIISNDLNSKRTIMIKSQNISNIDPSQYCASKLIYDLFLQIKDISAFNWISAIGIIGDFGIKTWKSFLDSVAQSNPEKLKILFEAEELVTYAHMCDGEKGIEKAYQSLYSAKNPDDVVENLKEYGAVRTEIGYFVENSEKLGEFRESIGLFYYEITPKYNIKSKVSNILSTKKYAGNTVIVVQLDKKKATISARNQAGKMSMDALMRECTKGLKEANGGGHVPAAGGAIRREDVVAFKEKIADYLLKHIT
ncbi:MAG: DHH family phosphoesterase [Candidatus Aenigmarchaeota archaeon]|nr:DHH family phosphoesterase [Candidatus Aenigmarchaeota archaeon]